MIFIFGASNSDSPICVPQSLSEVPIKPVKSQFFYDSVNKRIEYFIDNSRFCNEESLKVVLPRFEFESNDVGHIFETIIDSLQKYNGFTSSYLEYDAQRHFISTTPIGCAAEARGLLLCERSMKPLYITNSMSDSLLKVYHLNVKTVFPSI